MLSQKDENLPYEKFLSFGPEALTEAELLAIIIRTGTKASSSLDLAKQILELPKKQKGLLGLHELSLQDLMSVKGIGEVKAVKLKCITELSKRLSKANAKKGLQFTNPSSIAAYYMEMMRHLPYEQVILLLLDGKNHLIKEIILSKGTVNASLLSPRDVFQNALEYGAVYLLLIHNHPSGDATPSRQDLELTKRIKELSILMEIPLLDHIIIGDNTYSSLKEQKQC